MDLTISRASPLRGAISVPGDKSISHRALLIAALAHGNSTIEGCSDAADPKSTRECLSALGITIEEKSSHLLVAGRGLRGFTAPTRHLDAGNSGTTMRLLAGILSGQPFTATLRGDASLSRRPMRRVIEPLVRMGARITATEKGTAPLHITGDWPLKPIDYELPVASAQVKSAVLLAGLFAQGTTRVIESIPTRDHTERMIGLRAQDIGSASVIEVTGGMQVEPRRFVVPGDISAAAFLVAAALLVPSSEVRLIGIGLNPTRSRPLDIFRMMGGSVEVVDRRDISGEPIGDLLVRSSALGGSVSISGRAVTELIDEIPILAVTAACAGCSFSVRDAAELRQKESDRIRSLVVNLRRLGCEVEEHADGFAFEGKKPLLSAVLDSFGDHRIAMAFGVAALALPGEMTIRGAECVEISYPGFWQTLQTLQKTSSE